MSFDCQSTRAFLAPQPGPRPNSPEAVEAFAHLEACPECAAIFAGQRRTAERVRVAGLSTLIPPHLRDRVMARIASLDSGVRSRLNHWLSGMAVAAAAVLALWLGPPPTEPFETPQPFVTQALTLATPSQMMETTSPGPLAEWFARNGIDGFEIPDIADARLWRGRVTRVGGQLSAAVDFQLAGQVPFTYIMVPQTAVFHGITESDILTMQSEGWNVALWAENGTARAVLSTMGQEDLVLVAEACRNKAAL